MGAATFGILRYFNTVLYYQHSTVHSGVVLKMITYCNNILYLNLFKKFIPTIPVYTCIYCIINYKQGSVVRRPDSTIHWIVIFSTFVKLAVDRYNLRLRFVIYKLKFLRSIVGSRSVVSKLFGQFYEGCIIRYPVDSLSGLRTTGP